MGLHQRYDKILEFDKYISPDGIEYNFHTGLDKFTFSFEGMGLSPQEYLTQRGPFQHGETLVDFFLQPRVIQLLHRRQSCSRNAYWDARSDLINHLRPNRQAIGEFGPGVLRKTLPDGTKRDISVIISEGMRFTPRNTEAWDEYAFTGVIRFIAHDPTFFDPTEEEITFSLSISDHLVFPVTLINGAGEDMLFGESTINDTQTISYAGTWLSYPTIVLTGPMENPIIENTTTDEKIELGYNISVGEIVTVVLEYGNKIIVELI